MRTVAVLGGGIGGLAASYYLSKSPQVTKVIVLESSSRFGGWLWSTRRSDGAVFEHGPRGIRPAGAVGRNTLNMVDDLGLGGEILPVTYSHIASKNRYLYVNQRLHRMPSGISGLLRTVPPFSRPLLLSVAMEILVKKGKEDDESIHSFVTRRLGKEVHLEDGVISADHIISALPAKALSSALPSSCEPLIQQLQHISTVTVAVVNLEYEGSILPVTGFGHLLPSSEDLGILGVVYDSVPFPQHNRPNGQTTRLTVMMGGAWFQEVFGDPEAVTEEHLLARANEAVRCHLGVTKAPSWSRVALQRDCIPQYYKGHFQKLKSMRSFIRQNNLSLSLVGSSYDGVSVNDVIFNGQTAVSELLGTGV